VPADQHDSFERELRGGGFGQLRENRERGEELQSPRSSHGGTSQVTRMQGSDGGGRSTRFAALKSGLHALRLR
jgi:hypothetical protein